MSVVIIKNYYRALLFLFVCLAFSNNTRANGTISLHTAVSKDSIVIRKSVNNKKNNTRLYLNDTKEGLCFTAKGKKGKSYQLFLFNMDGKLIKQSKIQEKQTALLSEIEKGNYLFEVFNDDLRIENGSIVIK